MFFLSVDWIMGKEEILVLSTLSQIMAAKMDKPISYVTGWVNVRIAIVVVRSYSRVLRGAQSPSPLRTQEPECASISVLGLAQKLFCAKIELRTHMRTHQFESNHASIFV